MPDLFVFFSNYHVDEADGDWRVQSVPDICSPGLSDLPKAVDVGNVYARLHATESAKGVHKSQREALQTRYGRKIVWLSPFKHSKPDGTFAEVIGAPKDLVEQARRDSSVAALESCAAWLLLTALDQSHYGKAKAACEPFCDEEPKVSVHDKTFTDNIAALQKRLADMTPKR